MGVGIAQRVQHGLICLLYQAMTSTNMAFRHLEDFLVSSAGSDAPFYTCHVILSYLVDPWGSKRLIFGVSDGLPGTICENWRRVRLALRRRKWPRLRFIRINFPFLVILNRAAAPLCVLSFGTSLLLLAFFLLLFRGTLDRR